jgi:hypothetical protein
MGLGDFLYGVIMGLGDFLYGVLMCSRDFLYGVILLCEIITPLAKSCLA